MGDIMNDLVSNEHCIVAAPLDVHLRDHFAGIALASLIRKMELVDNWPMELAADAYLIADAMMKERRDTIDGASR